ncbi:hypothetical protein RD792_007463 [Penstemon davidsonii]|uniref:Uncharacterized protein n=1 Tax=Penstemon davidsonii TaxID=160366 RepID=A0ABR0D6I4_9LAMI|nr:hypothetical protein RD792_007463 [Penstemon davidsonii]
MSSVWLLLLICHQPGTVDPRPVAQPVRRGAGRDGCKITFTVRPSPTEPATGHEGRLPARFGWRRIMAIGRAGGSGQATRQSGGQVGRQKRLLVPVGAGGGWGMHWPSVINVVRFSGNDILNGMKKGAWSEEEDNKLRAYVLRYGHWNWRLLPKYAGLARCGKSCRLRWVNYLKPGVKRGSFTKHEEDLIIKLHQQLGNKWSLIAEKLPGRTDNDIKNYWHAHIKKNKGANANLSTDKCSKLQHTSTNNQAPMAATISIGTSASYEANSSDSTLLELDHVNFWTTEPFIADHSKNDYFPIGDFFQPQSLNYSELSSSGSFFSTEDFNWIDNGDDDNCISNTSSDSVTLQSVVMQENFWNEPFAYDYQGEISHLPEEEEEEEEEGLFYDMNLF